MKGFALNTVLWPTVLVVLVVLVQGEVRRFFTQRYLCAPEMSSKDVPLRR